MATVDRAGIFDYPEVGLRAWESGIEALLIPTAANPSQHNLAVFLDNHRPLWHVALTSVSADREA